MNNKAETMTFLILSDNVKFRKLLHRNLLFIWENSTIIESSEQPDLIENVDFSTITVAFVEEGYTSVDNIEWVKTFTTKVENPPVVFITEQRDENYARQLLKAGIKAILAKTELTKKKILNAVDLVLITPDSTIEFDGGVYVGDQGKQPALPGYKVHKKNGDDPVSWLVSKREIKSSCEAFIFRQFVKAAEAEAVLKTFSVLKKIENPVFMNILDVNLLPGSMGYLFLVQKKYDIGLRSIQPGSLPAKVLIRHMLKLIRGMEDLHKAGFVCEFLHPDFCFLDKNGHLILSLAAMLAFKKKSRSVYASPEKRRGEKTDKRSGYYSLAAVFHYFICGTDPDAGIQVNYNSEYKVLEKVIEGALVGSLDKRYASAKEFERFIRIKCGELLELA